MAAINSAYVKENGISVENEDDEKNFWADILSEVQSSSQTKLPTSKCLLVLGDNEIGKTSLIAKLQGLEEPKKGSGLEYLYLNVRDDYRDDNTRLGAWLVDGDLHYRGLLKYILTEQTYPHTVALFVASLAQPWDIADSLQRWSAVLESYVERLKLSPDNRKQQERSQVQYFQDYIQPEEGSTDGSSQPRRPPHTHHTTDNDVDSVTVSLEENTLTNNLGIPIIVVLTKSDAISALEKNNDFRNEHFDFIQQYVRKFCLRYGAALFYVSVKENKNCSVLYKYLVHRIYGFPFDVPASIVDRDAIFVPAGWDSEKKISILYETMMNFSPDSAFNDIIPKPIVRKLPQREGEVSAEDEQLFLMKLQGLLSKQPAAAATAGGTSQRESPLRGTSAAMQRPSSSPRPAGSTVTPPKKLDPSKPGATAASEGVLANFFNSLLNKKTPGGVTSPENRSAEPDAVGIKTDHTDADHAHAALSRNAALELDKMTRADSSASSPSDLKSEQPKGSSSTGTKTDETNGE